MRLEAVVVNGYLMPKIAELTGKEFRDESATFSSEAIRKRSDRKRRQKFSKFSRRK